MAFLIKKQSFKKMTNFKRDRQTAIKKERHVSCLNEIFELTILMLTFCQNVFLKDI